MIGGIQARSQEDLVGRADGFVDKLWREKVRKFFTEKKQQGSLFHSFSNVVNFGTDLLIVPLLEFERPRFPI